MLTVGLEGFYGGVRRGAAGPAVHPAVLV